MQFLQRLREVEPNAVVTKYNDRTTSGLPDASLTYHGRTIWMEFKAWPSHHVVTTSLHILLRRTNQHARLQITELWRHQIASEGRAFLVMLEPDQRVTLYHVTEPYPQPDFKEVASGTTTEMCHFLFKCCQDDW